MFHSQYDCCFSEGCLLVQQVPGADQSQTHQSTDHWSLERAEMGSVCGKLRTRARSYAVSARSVTDDAQVQTYDPPLKKAKGAGQQGSDGGHSSISEQQTKAIAAAAAANPMKPDPKDFMWMNLKSESKLKPPGSINGQQFIIDSCEDCDLFVLDACAMVTIDDCKNCRIFIGPTESSTFIRNCTNCQLACITRQLRTRDCHSCDILLMSRTRPIIESSTNIGIGCYSTPYAGLAQHMAMAKLNPFHNFWSDLFDFTPAATPTSQQHQRNWKLLPTGTGLLQVMGRVPHEALMFLQQQDVTAGSNSLAAAADDMSRSSTGEVALADYFRSSASSPDPGTTAGGAVDADTSSGVRGYLTAASAAAGPEGPLQEDSIELALDGNGTSGKSEQDGSAPEADISYQPGGGRSSAVQDDSAEQAAALHRIELSKDDVQWVIVTAGELCDVQQIPEGCFACLLFAPGHRTQVLEWVAQQFGARISGAAASAGAQELSNSNKALLLRTNEAVIEPNVLKQVVAAAGWTNDLTKELTAAAQQQQTCIGLEIKCGNVEQRQQMTSQAEAMSGLCCSSLQAAKLFRNLGTDG